MECSWRENIKPVRIKESVSDDESRQALELIKEAPKNEKLSKEIIFNSTIPTKETSKITLLEDSPEENSGSLSDHASSKTSDIRYLKTSESKDIASKDISSDIGISSQHLPSNSSIKDSSLGEYINKIRDSNSEANSPKQFMLSPSFVSLAGKETPFGSQFASHFDINMSQNYFLEMVSPSPSAPISMFPQIDGKGGLFLDSYINQCARVVCIGPDSSNYFLKTFYQLASTDNSIMYAVAAWGGLFVEGYSLRVKTYMASAADLIQKKYPSHENLSKSETFTLLSFYIVMMSLEICAGDVYNWNQFFHKATELIKKNHGLEQICRQFDYSNDIKFLISDVFFHDIFSSNAFSGNSQFPISEYYSIFHHSKILEFGNYGLDPLQGCLQPVYLILAELNSVASDLHKRKLELDRELRVLALNSSYLVKDEDTSHLRQLRIEYYEDANHQFNILQEKLHNCKPNLALIELIMDDKKELELHLTLFEVYLYTCQLCINTKIKGMAPSAIEQQVLLLNCLNGIDILAPTKFVSALALLLLICGINCCNPSDRIEMQKRIEKIQERYFVANVLRVLEIIEEAWRQNKSGNRCIDWTDICKKKNWNLSVC